MKTDFKLTNELVEKLSEEALGSVLARVNMDFLAEFLIKAVQIIHQEITRDPIGEYKVLVDELVGYHGRSRNLDLYLESLHQGLEMMLNEHGSQLKPGGRKMFEDLLQVMEKIKPVDLQVLDDLKRDRGDPARMSVTTRKNLEDFGLIETVTEGQTVLTSQGEIFLSLLNTMEELGGKKKYIF